MLTRLKTASVLFLPTVALAAAGMLVSCNDDSTIGKETVSDNVEVIIDSSFVLTGHSIENNDVRSRTITQLLGNIQATGFGSLSSDIVTQFMPAIRIDSTLTSADNIDSLQLTMAFESTAFTGDSIVPMGVQVYRLTKDLPSPIYSNFDPTGYYNPAQPIGSTVYNLSWNSLSSDEMSSGNRTVRVNLPVELGRDLFNAYKANPSTFASPELFAKNVFKGLYIRTSFGSGRIIRVAKTLMNIHYHYTTKYTNALKQERDTTLYLSGSYFAVTPEIISNNNIRLSLAKDVTDMVSNGSTVIAAPCGLDAEIVFPARKIIESYRNNITNLGVINNLSMRLAVESIDNKYEFTPPPNLLMVLKKDKDKFFAENKIADNKTSFVGGYESSTNSYNFSGLRDYLLSLMDKEKIEDEDVTFVLTPVTVNTETQTDYYYGTTSTVVTAVIPFISYPVLAKIDYSKTKITLTYTKQTIGR